MTASFPPIPESCARTLAAIEADPLELTPEAESHVAACPACAEARVAWLAQEEASAQAPAGYFERLPERILAKLPTPPRRRPVQAHLALWALAATLLAAVAVGGFWAGRANRAPLVEATLTPAAAETREALPDTPFHEAEDDYAQLPELSPEQAHAVIERVGAASQRP